MQQEMFSHFALISVELANSFWPRKLSAAPIGVFFKRETLFEALVEHFVLRLQVVHEEEAVRFSGRLLIQPVQLLLRQQGAEELHVDPHGCADEPQLLRAHPGADLHVTASDEERVKGAMRLVELRRVNKVVDDYKHLVQFLHFQLLGRFRDLALLLDDAPQGGLIPLVPVSLLTLRVQPQRGFDCHFAFAFPNIADLQPNRPPAPGRHALSLIKSHLGQSTCHPSTSVTRVEPGRDIQINYPGELLDADTTPSIRLLSLVHKGLKPGQSLKWVPWQYRLSSRQHQERMEAKSARAVRSELQLLSQAFFDDTPEVSVEHHSLSAGWLTRIQTVFAMPCAPVEFDKKIADLCLTQPDPNLGLCTRAFVERQGVWP